MMEINLFLLWNGMNGRAYFLFFLPFYLGHVNCYLIKTADGFVLIDTGGTNQRRKLLRQLNSCQCSPGKLRLIILTHGDFDHSGNAAYLREHFGGRIAMSPLDQGMIEHRDLTFNRKGTPDFARPFSVDYVSKIRSI
jgi:glyoxylase-like metal-dependent hydrolase (beta-lactamase superfamily II)